MSEPLRPQSLESFFQSGQLPYAEQIHVSLQHSETPGNLERPVLNPEIVRGYIGELSEQNAAVQKGPYAFERRIIKGAEAQGMVHFWSTSNAGGRTNPSNLVDAAVYATVARMHGYDFAYWALPGNSGTTGMRQSERSLYARTGSLLQETEEGLKPTGYAEAWAKLVASSTEGKVHLFGKGHGGIVATAIGIALGDSKRVGTTLQIERPGLVDVNGKKLIAAQAKDELGAEHGVEYEPDDEYGPHRNAKLLEESLAPDFRRPIWHFVNSPTMLLAHMRAAKRGPHTGGFAERDLMEFRRLHPNADMRFITSAGDVTSAVRQQQMKEVGSLLARIVAHGEGNGYVEYSAIPGSRKALSQAPQVVAALMASTLELADAA